MTRWWIGVSVAAGTSFAVLVASGFDPEPLRVVAIALLTGAAAQLVGALVRAGGSGESAAESEWELPLPRQPETGGADARTALHRRTLEAHLTARHPDDALARRLAALGGSEPKAASPAQRMSVDEIESALERIEAS